MNIIKVKSWSEIPINYTGIIEWENEDKCWLKNGKRHREDGPAVVWSDGNKEWFKNGKRHREDGPAVIQNDGYKEWWLDGKIIWDSSDKFDLKNYIVLSKEQHPKYSTVQVWKYFTGNRIKKQIIVPEMEKYIIE